ncbi:MAG: hypothetical protein COX79_04170 [Candidatus Levybacteria bacterium CG_4_10_14_0_2_um_filter_36_16]|nr:MAG: hypothetical protein COU26_03660 [Candidatus Levybacteria bacterium CG10_big_fil_rev_8_21_14_0_10_36_30]PIZ96909.1 MAG: hypothetical protein COX79_04170 [Candidatus Levybacteria bacterium CG_4_10_14_0_2_um_filter_36_16]
MSTRNKYIKVYKCFFQPHLNKRAKIGQWRARHKSFLLKKLTQKIVITIDFEEKAIGCFF